MAVKKAKRKRRSKGDGGIYYNESAGRWESVVELARVGGKRRRRRFTGATRAEVKVKLRQYEREREEGVRADGRMTLETYLSRWLAEGRPKSVKPRAAAGYESMVRVRIVPLIGHIRLDKLTALDVQEMCTKLGEPHLRDGKEVKGLSAQAILNTYRCLKGALRQAVGWGLVARNVAEGATPPRPGRAAINPLTRNEVTTFLASSFGSPDHPLWLVAITTGMRQGELLGLRWRDVDLKARRLRVVQTLQRVTGKGRVFGEPKSDSSRRSIVLSNEAISALKEQGRRQNLDRIQVANLWEDNDLVFARAFGRPDEGSEVRRRLGKALTHAGVRDVRFHDLRHTCATLLFEVGTHPKVVSELLGHSSIAITLDIYSHYIPALHEQAASAMDELLGS